MKARGDKTVCFYTSSIAAIVSSRGWCVHISESENGQGITY